MQPIIRFDEFQTLANEHKILLFDVRTGPDPKGDYQKKHLKNAVFVDLNSDLALIDDPKNGGRHPLPQYEDFIKTLGNLGIKSDSHVVIYDDKSGANAAARFWWMLRAVGHRNVQVLDGGFQWAENAGYPLETGDNTYPATSYVSEYNSWQLPQVLREDVKLATKDPSSVIVDVRESFRYDGISEPIDLVAGHIPNAENFPFINNLNENGSFRSVDELRAIYSQLFEKCDKDKMIFHCGSGVTACHSLLALDYAGFGIPNLYVGSWSEWSRNEV